MNQSIISVDLVASALRSEDLGAIPREILVRDAADYERFLLLAQRYPSEPLAPTRAIDRMWHLHMLHPRQYAADCDQLFGDLLDHNGGFGATPDEAPLLTAAFAKTRVLWRHEFGTEYTGDGSDIVACTRNCVSRCQRRCSSRVDVGIETTVGNGTTRTSTLATAEEGDRSGREHAPRLRRHGDQDRDRGVLLSA